MDAPQQLSDNQFDLLHYVNVSVGSTNHLTNLAVSLGDWVSAILAAQCFFCPGTDLYDPTQSTSFQVRHTVVVKQIKIHKYPDTGFHWVLS